MKKLSYFHLLLGLIFFLLQGSLIAEPIEIKPIETKHQQGTFIGAKDAQHPNWFKDSFLDIEDDIADATDAGKRLVVYFWQPGCPYCSQLWEDNFSQQKIESDFRKHFEIVALNMWGDREIVSVGGNDYSEKSFANALHIAYTPTLLFFNENKKVVHKMQGYIPPEDFQLAMSYVSGKHDKQMKFGEFIASRAKETKEKTVGKLHDESFYSTTTIFDRRSESDKNNYLAVYFEKPNCKNCDLLHEKTLQDKTTQALAKQFTAVQLNRYADTKITLPNGNNSTILAWANELGIGYLPAMVFFNKKGEEVMRIDTQMRTFHVQSVFDYVLSGAYKTEKNFQRYISDRSEKIRESGKNVDISIY